jgi:Tfp pilus assembly protein PilF
LFFYEWDWVKAEKEYRRARELDPNYATANHWYSWFLLTQKRFDEAIVEVNVAQRLDPGSLTLATNLGLPFYFRGEYVQASAYYREALEMDPDFTLAHYYLALALLRLGHYGEAISSLNKDKGVYQQQVMGQLGYAYASMGRRTEALRLLHDLQKLKQHDYVSPYVEAVIYVALEDRNQALALLEKALEERAAWLVFLQIEPCFEPLRSERRFRRLIQKLWG